jgi:nicotinamidase-related amidase
MHICVDMQRLFAEDTGWKTPWMGPVLPVVSRLVSSHPGSTVFTRFIPAWHPDEGLGTWRRYWRRWPEMTVKKMGLEMTGLVPELARFVPPAAVFDKHVYSPWYEPDLHTNLKQRSIDTLVVSGAETDVCVLSTVLGAIDRGYRVVIATDAVCSSSDQTHDALLTLYQNRYSEQVETVTADVIIENWR